MEVLSYFNVTKEEVITLNKHAMEAVKHASAEYSKFYVGAAILTESGQIYEGCNVENASYGATVCAERCAVFRMVASGERKIKAISVYIVAKNFNLYPSPCGMCRQVMAEFGYFPIICAKSPTCFIVKTVSSMLPYIFRELETKEVHFKPNPKVLAEIIDAAEYWLQMDPYTPTRRLVENWLVEDKFDEMKKAFCGRIDFGTAGLRGEMGPGYTRMNYLVVQQTAQGIAKCLLEKFGKEECAKRGVTIGYDGRHNSKGYAHISAAVFAHYGVKCNLFDDFVTTPLLSYSTLKFNSLAGIMVTASHNPKQDNGYKVYWSNGAQIISPIDKDIRTEIGKNLVPLDLSEHYDYMTHKLLKPVEPLVEKALALYKADAMKICHFNAVEVNAKCKDFVYTAMHGVGYRFASALFHEFGFKDPIPVKEQIVPDGDFPTVEYPNPEEGEGSLKLSMETAERSNCTFIIANDPDADRLAIAEKFNGKWKIFTGDEIGHMLSYYLVSKAKARKPDLTHHAMVASTVSSKLIRAIAEKNGMKFVETLTGFKWISNKVLDLEKEGFEVVFSYEEAIGYSVGSLVRDKDGVAAGACLAELYAILCQEGKSFNEYLENIYKEYGYYITRNHYFLCYDPNKMMKIFNIMRNNGAYSKKCGDYNITSIRDLTTGYDSSTNDKATVLPASSSTQMITFTFENGVICTLRGSGTEPKLKYYTENHGATREETKGILDKVVESVIANFLKPEEFGLDPPKTIKKQKEG